MAALDTALAFHQVNNVAMMVGQDLKLHMPGSGNVAFQEHSSIPEGSGSFPLGGFHGGSQVIGVGDQPHAPAAASRRGLDQQGIPQVCPKTRGFLSGRLADRGAGNHGHGGLAGKFLGADLVA